MAPSNISLEDFRDASIDGNGRIKAPTKFEFKNVLKKSNTLSLFTIDPTTKLFDKMINFFKNITPISRVDQYWCEYSKIFHDMICDKMTKTNGKTPHVSKYNIHSVTKFVASMSTCSAITKTEKISGHRPYTRDKEHDTLFLVMSLTDIFMMHVFTGSHKIAQYKFSEHEFDETKAKFIQISCGEAVLFK